MTDSFYALRSPEAISRRREESRLVQQAPGAFEKYVSVIPYGGQPRDEAAFEVKYQQSVLQSLFDDEIPDLVLDLIEIAVLTFAVDKYVERDIDIQGNDADDLVNTRSIKLHVPVLSDVLTEREAELLISDIVSHCTRDLFEYEFVKWEVDTSRPLPFQASDGPDAVSLLSDGIDSTGGLFYNELEGIESAYTTLNYGQGIGPTVEKISDATGVNPSIHGINFPRKGTEFTQFSRGFLHLTYGVAVAIALGADTVQSFENGIVARFSVLTDGWMTTRTVSPYLIRRYNALLDQVIGDSLRVTNPFAYKTKTEITNLIPETDLVFDTVSCPHSGWYSGSPRNNCNLCVPCIIRTIALLNSQHEVRLDELGIFDSFRTADFTELRFPPDGQVLRKYSETKRSLPLNESANSPQTFLDAMAEISYFTRLILTQDRTTVLREHSDIHAEPVFELHKEFAENYVTALETMKPENPSVQALLPPVTR